MKIGDRLISRTRTLEIIDIVDPGWQPVRLTLFNDQANNGKPFTMYYNHAKDMIEEGRLKHKTEWDIKPIEQILKHNFR
jgi:protein involved in temperature-dependent protein secretion